MAGTHKTATVLFTDLVASTQLVQRLGPDGASDVLARHFSALRDALAVHRGVEVKTLGDGIMAVFESVTDGLACAVTMQRAVTRQNRLAPSIELAMRVGLSTGETSVDGEDYFGPPVIEASRLCAEAGGGGILVSDLLRLLVTSSGMHRLRSVGELELKGLPGPIGAWAIEWDPEEDYALRVALADDSVLLRQGMASVLSAAGIDVVLQTSDAESLIEALSSVRPHVVVLDVRMPPTHTTEGLDAAHRIKDAYPDIGVLVLSASVDPAAARHLLRSATDGVGYLLKDRVTDVEELLAAIRSVAAGGSAIDPEVLGRLE
jgi:class 3 adenylate cyclase/CheY-like chemotaxis protein